MLARVRYSSSSILYNVFKAKTIMNKGFASAPKSGKHYDIVIAGGGMVGTTLACALGKSKVFSNLKILLLEGSPTPGTEWKPPDKYSNRVSSLNSSTVQLLKEINAWQHISCVRFGPVNRMQVWDALSDATITFNHDDMEREVAIIVENDLLLNAVSTEICKSQVEVLYGAKIKKCSPGDQNSEGFVTVGLEGDDDYSCELLLGCDGANSLVRKSMGLHHISFNYNHMGVVATLKLPEDFENVVAWQRHLPNSGFIAMLPLSNGFSSLVWSTGVKEAKNLIKMSDDEFTCSVNEAIWKVYPKNPLVNQATRVFDNFIRYLDLPSTCEAQMPPKILGCEPNSRAAFPLGLGHATNYIGKGVVLVGDAAHRVHPLAGQGVNLGFGDIVCLNKILKEAVYSGSGIGEVSLLKQYESERQRHNIPIMLAVHGLFHLYSTQFTPLVLLRSLGLQMTHALTPLKKLLISKASGEVR